MAQFSYRSCILRDRYRILHAVMSCILPLNLNPVLLLKVIYEAVVSLIVEGGHSLGIDFRYQFVLPLSCTNVSI